jgi:hypothetical protein
MYRLNEQIKRIKSLMLINEQCGSDLEQCEKDLEEKGYKVTSPNELSFSCDNNDVIKCVKEWAQNNGIGGKLTIGSVGSSVDDCYVLFKGNKNVSGGPTKFFITFYADNQVVISKRLDSNNGGKKLIYRSEFKCDSSSGPSIFGGKQFKYIGIRDGNSSKFENEPLKDANGREVLPTSVMMTDWGVGSPVNYQDTLSYYLNQTGIVSNKKIRETGLNSTDIIKIINH